MLITMAPAPGLPLAAAPSRQHPVCILPRVFPTTATAIVPDPSQYSEAFRLGSRRVAPRPTVLHKPSLSVKPFSGNTIRAEQEL